MNQGKKNQKSEENNSVSHEHNHDHVHNEQPARNASHSDAGGQTTNTEPSNEVDSKKKLGRNDPCWCGSGKKWKKCHYPQTSA